MKKYLIFGATGSIGSALAKELYDDKKECHLIGRDEDAIKKQNRIIQLCKKYDVDLKIIDTSNCGDVGSMSVGEFKKRKNIAIQPDLDDILFIDKIKNI